MPRPRELRDSELSDADMAALQLAIDMTLADPPSASSDEWRDAALGCVYHQQITRLGLPPWASPPCWIVTREEAEAILETEPMRNGNDRDISNHAPAQLLLDMLDCGVSAFHPDPVRAVNEARRAKRGKRP
jgi:hypothetical protein